MISQKNISSLINERAAAINNLEACCKDINDAAVMIATAFKAGKKLFVCGNGGSAADAQHMVAELVGRFTKDRIALPAISLTTDTSILTAVGNDWDYDYIFRRQLEALGNTDDVIIGISTSGNSSNILEAFAHARLSGIKVIGITGRDAGKMKNRLCDIIINVGGEKTHLIQEMHIAVEHIICELVESFVCNSLLQ